MNDEKIDKILKKILVDDNDIKLIEKYFKVENIVTFVKLLKFFGIKDEFSLKFYFNLNKSILNLLLDKYSIKYKVINRLFNNKENYKVKYPILAFNLDCKNLVIYKNFFIEFNEILHEIDENFPNNYHQKLYRASLRLRENLPKADNIRYFYTWLEFQDYIKSDESLKELLNIIFKRWKITRNIRNRKRKPKIVSENINKKFYSSEQVAQVIDDEHNKINFFAIEESNSKNSFLNEDEITYKEEIGYIESKRGKFKRNIKKFVISSEIQKFYIHHFFDKSTISINLFEKLLNKSLSHPIAAILTLSALTGIKWEDILKIIKGKHPDIKISTTLKFYCYKYPFEAHESLDIIPKNYSSFIILYLPEFLHLLFKYLSDNYFDQFSKKEISNYIKNELNYQYTYRITSERIANFIFFYLVQRYELPLMDACCISKRFQYVSTQIRYTRINFISIHNNFLLSIEKLFKYLNYSFVKNDKYSPYKNAKSNIYSASKIVPDYSDIKDFFKDLKNYINQLPKNNFNEKILKITYINLYCYFLIQALTGHRPINEFDYNYKNLSFSPPFILITDKMSTKFAEIRYIPLCSYLKKQIEKVAEIINEIKQINNIRNNSYKADFNNFFVLFDFNNKQIHYTFKNIKELLKPIGKCIVFNYPKNFWRHFFRTYLYNKKIEEKLIDAIMGHVRYGNEIFNIFSTIQINDYINKAIKIQEKILKDLEINEIIKL